MTIAEIRESLMTERFDLTANPDIAARYRQDVARSADQSVIADAKAQMAELFDPMAAAHWDCLAKAINPRRTR